MKTIYLCVLLAVLAGCKSSESAKAKPMLVAVSASAYTAEQVDAICKSEALNVRAAVRANRPSRVVVTNGSSGGGFAGGFAEGFNRSYNPGPSGREEGEAAYAACVARNGYVLR